MSVVGQPSVNLHARPLPEWECLSFAIAFAALFAAAALIRINPGFIDYPVARAVNGLAANDGTVNQLIALATYPAIQGVLVVSLLWSCWFSRTEPECRGRLVRGAAAGVLAAVASHFAQDLLPPLVKPIFDANLQIHPPKVLGDFDELRASANPGASSFPSERATLFAALAVAIFTVNRGLGLLALGLSASVELCRVYLGLHAPSDILGSFFLGAAAVWLVEAGTRRRLGRLIVRWESLSPASFYAAAFIASYALATTFQDLRELAARLPH